MASSHANFVAVGPGKGYHLGEALSSENGPPIALSSEMLQESLYLPVL